MQLAENTGSINYAIINFKHRRAAAKPAACAKPLMPSTVGREGEREKDR